MGKDEGLPGVSGKESHRFSFKINNLLPPATEVLADATFENMFTLKAGLHAKETGHTKPTSSQKERNGTSSCSCD